MHELCYCAEMINNEVSILKLFYAETGLGLKMISKQHSFSSVECVTDVNYISDEPASIILPFVNMLGTISL